MEDDVISDSSPWSRSRAPSAAEAQRKAETDARQPGPREEVVGAAVEEGRVGEGRGNCGGGGERWIFAMLKEVATVRPLEISSALNPLRLKRPRLAAAGAVNQRQGRYPGNRY